MLPEQWEIFKRAARRESVDKIPSWGMEYGMAMEPSVLGAKIKFWQDNTPSEYHTLQNRRKLVGPTGFEPATF